jgi:tRNA threonylcarbamoyladenosine biosynthesis protein TsaB
VIVLAADTSTPVGSLALLRDEAILVEVLESARITRTGRLLPAIAALLAQAELTLADVDAFAVVHGPGSFTGVRVGLATIKGLAFAAGKPACGVNSLEAIAHALRFSALPVCPVLDARKGQVFAALFEGDGAGGLVRVRGDVSVPPDELADSLTGPVLFTGGGLAVWGDRLRTRAPAGSMFADPPLWYSRASVVGRIALPWLREGVGTTAAELAAHYVRRSEAEIAAAGKP